MEYKALGNTGLLVSQLCLGTMTMGSGSGVYSHIGDVGQADANNLIKAALEAGINFFDTADVYSSGESEKTLGQAFKDLGILRKDVVLATKFYSRISAEDLNKIDTVSPLPLQYPGWMIQNQRAYRI